MSHDNIKVCNSFDLVGDDYKLSSILKTLKDIHKTGKIHVFIEEFNGEAIDNEEIQRIIPLLKNTYQNCHVMLVAQTIECKWFKRATSSGLERIWSNQYDCLSRQTDFQIFFLSYSMRTSNKINDLLDIAIPVLRKAKIRSILPKSNM